MLRCGTVTGFSCLPAGIAFLRVSPAGSVDPVWHSQHMLRAYIDESGVAGEAARSSKHFVLGAFVFDEADAERAHAYLDDLRVSVGRQRGHLMHWNQINQHGARRYLAQSLGEQEWIKLSAVVVCRDFIPDSLPNTQLRYQYTLRFLLERLSWFAASKRTVLHYTLSHYLGMQENALRDYEERLRRRPDQIKIRWLDPAGATIARNDDVELLQFGDMVASSTACAFEPDRWGYVERDYLRRMSPRFYRHKDALIRYGLKFHPNSAVDRSDNYSWTTELA